MSKLKLDLPTLQNWDCHNCSGCCRQHGIFITDEEKARIESQGWTAEHGVPADQTLVVKAKSGLFVKPRYRLAHQADGACVFLDEQGLCRIHARFEEAAKPLACRIYPYAFHPKGRQVAVGLRFSCPSVVKNLGTPVQDQDASIRRIANLVLENAQRDLPPPLVFPNQRLDWPDVLQFVDALDDTIASGEGDFCSRLLRAIGWMKLVAESSFEKVRGSRLTEFLELIQQASGLVPAEEPSPPQAVARVQFRMLVAQYARKDTFADMDEGLRGRWKLLRAALRFTRGKGTTPILNEAFAEVPFTAIEQPFGELPEGADEILTRYFRVKIQSLHFAGAAYYDVSLVEGFSSLALIFPAFLWLARWRAVSQGRDSISLDDLITAITIADHHHGYSPAFGMWSFRRRVRILSQLNAIESLCRWYSQ